MDIRTARVNALKILVPYFMKSAARPRRREEMDPWEQEIFDQKVTPFRGQVPVEDLPYDPRHLNDPRDPKEITNETEFDLPTGNLLADLDILARAQFVTGLRGVPSSTLNRLNKRQLLVWITKTLSEFNPKYDFETSVWSSPKNTGLYSGPLKFILRTFGDQGADAFQSKMMGDAKESIYYIAGHTLRSKAEFFASGEGIELVQNFVRKSIKNFIRDLIRERQVEQRKLQQAQEIGMVPGGYSTGEDFGDEETLNFMDTRDWDLVLEAVIANPRHSFSRKFFGWVINTVLPTSTLTDTEQQIILPYLVSASQGDVGSKSDAAYAAEAGVESSRLSQVKRRFMDEANKAFRRNRPDFLNEAEDAATLAQILKGKARLAAVKAASAAFQTEAALRASVVRLASENPSLRRVLIPLLAK